MDQDACYSNCFLCGRRFRCGPSIYNGNRIPAYEINVCRICYRGNWDGFTFKDAEKIETHLKAKGIPIPKRNAEGWLPRDGEPRIFEIVD